MIANCGMIEFPYKGNPMSWVGYRSSGKVQCRLDRALGNEDWHHLFSHTNVEYLNLWGSDHRPVLATIQSRKVQVQLCFKLDKRWLGKDGLEEAIRDGWRKPMGPIRETFTLGSTMFGEPSHDGKRPIHQTLQKRLRT